MRFIALSSIVDAAVCVSATSETREQVRDWHSLSCGLGAPAMALFASQATWETGNLASSKVMALRTALD